MIGRYRTWTRDLLRVESAVLLNPIAKPYLAKNGRRKLTEAVKEQMGSEREDFAEARERAEAEQQRLTKTINNLLDNITPANREFVDGRLKELTDQRHQLEARLEELDRLTATQAEIQAIVTDALRFLSSLEFTLRQGVPQEKLTTLRVLVHRLLLGRLGIVVALKRQFENRGHRRETSKFERWAYPGREICPQQSTPHASVRRSEDAPCHRGSRLGV